MCPINRYLTSSLNRDSLDSLDSPPDLLSFFSLAEDMLKGGGGAATKAYFTPGGQLDKDGLVNFIKDVKKNTKLSDEDAAVLAASK